MKTTLYQEQAPRQAARPGRGCNPVRSLSKVFETHYADYVARLEALEFDRIAPILGLEPRGEDYALPFLNRCFTVSRSGIWDHHDQAPDYATFVILAQYLSRCPTQVYHDTQWAAFKDFKRDSHFRNLNYFTSDTEQKISSTFSGKPEALYQAARRLGGIPGALKLSYDRVLQFQALPRIALLLLFNDGDADFPAYGTVLFWRQSEFYLDPESLAMTSALLVRRLSKQLKAETA